MMATAFLGYVLVWGQMCEKSNLISLDNKRAKSVNSTPDVIKFLIHRKQYNIYNVDKVKIMNSKNGSLLRRIKLLVWYPEQIRSSTLSSGPNGSVFKIWIQVLTKNLKPRSTLTTFWTYILTFSRRILLGASERERKPVERHNTKSLQLT
jgi:hypothetical protein